MEKIKVLGLSGSLRVDSWNSKLLGNFLPALDPSLFECRFFGSIELPLFNQDLEAAPLPASVLALHAALAECQVIVVASPEYNGSFSAALKNAIDWATRPKNLWQGKVVAMLSASPGAMGGARGLIQLRTVLSGVKAWVIPEQVQCGQADSAFDLEGRLKNAAVEKQMQAAAASVANLAGKLFR